MIQIIPAILSTSEEDYARDVSRYKQSLLLRNKQSEFFKEGWVHIDFMDNKFVPNKSIEPSVIDKYPTNLHKEAHLMVSHPLEWIESLVKTGFERIIFHVESEDDINECIKSIKSKGLGVGLAINFETPIEKLTAFVHKIEVILVMTIKPGFQGQPFIPAALNKVKEIKSKNWPVSLGVDGHVRDENIKEVIKSGVDFVIAGSYLLKGDVDENLEILWEEIRG